MAIANAANSSAPNPVPLSFVVAKRRSVGVEASSLRRLKPRGGGGGGQARSLYATPPSPPPPPRVLKDSGVGAMAQRC